MNKQEFLAALARELEPLPREERYKTLNYYDELIDDRLEDGQDEGVVIQSLGDPKAVAEELLGGSTKQVQTKTMQAEETLRNLLDKPAPAEEILRRITAVGISERTLMTAKKNLGILSEKRGAQWFWRLPNGQGCKDVIH